MAIAMYFHPASFTAAQYDEVDKRLDAAGARTPQGRLHHSAFGSPDSIMVYDVWESQELFDKFGETLLPILADVGVDPGQPDVMPVHSLIQ
jgi:hypothetical protein